jgi:hypothetical protein
MARKERLAGDLAASRAIAFAPRISSFSLVSLVESTSSPMTSSTERG